jgi:hypothetical protein
LVSTGQKTPDTVDTPLYNRISDEDRAPVFARTADRLATNPFVTGATLRIDVGGLIA